MITLHDLRPVVRTEPSSHFTIVLKDGTRYPVLEMREIVIDAEDCLHVLGPGDERFVHVDYRNVSAVEVSGVVDLQADC